MPAAPERRAHAHGGTSPSTVTVPLVVILALGALDVVPDRAAIPGATIAALVELAAAGAYAARTSGARLRGAVVSAVVAVALGSAVVVLKALVH